MKKFFEILPDERNERKRESEMEQSYKVITTKNLCIF